MIKVLMFLLLVELSWGKVADSEIANMFMVGFEGKSLASDSQIMRDICDLGLGGVILFGKNIGSRSQLKTLTAKLSSCNHKPLIAVDQEGGKVRRIRFGIDYPRAWVVASGGIQYAKKLYEQMAKELQSLGINYNLAPVADLDIEPRNYIIHKLGRSYGADPKTVKRYNDIFIKAMKKYKILTALKHFPGHGSSLGDTHRGFVDVTKTWSKKELKPFLNRSADSVMMAHVVNRRIDPSGMPMSLSVKAIKLLRKHNSQAVLITDDLQMGAIRKYYSLKQTIMMAINAGDDILLFGNQLSRKDKVNAGQLINIVRELLRERKISETSIIKANRRIDKMRNKMNLKKTHHLKPKNKNRVHKKRTEKISEDLF